jgi:hypothetical protein
MGNASDTHQGDEPMKSALAALLSLAAIPLALSPHASLRTVTVTAHDFSLRLPDTLPEGPVTLRLVNEGKEFHHVWIARMEGGHEVQDVLQALAAPGGYGRRHRTPVSSAQRFARCAFPRLSRQGFRFV